MRLFCRKIFDRINRIYRIKRKYSGFRLWVPSEKYCRYDTALRLPGYAILISQIL